jgi:GMP synthase-like glutamine amidotransferase
VFGHVLAERHWQVESWLVSEGGQPPVDPFSCDAVLTFGGAVHVDQGEASGWMAPERQLLADLVERGVPQLGVCLGAQLLGVAAGGTAGRTSEPEIGWVEVDVTPAGAADPLIGPLTPRFLAFEWHSYEFSLPPGAVPLATTERCLQAYRIGRCAWGIQFHAEVTREDSTGWIEHYDTDEDAVALGLNWEALQAQTDALMPGWNAVGRGICRRFLDMVTTGF